MKTVTDALDSAINEASRARKRVAKIRQNQVRGVDDLAMLNATAQTWFHTHRPIVMAGAASIDLSPANQHYTTVINATAKHAAKKTYLDALKEVKEALVTVRAAVLRAPVVESTPDTDDLAPDFSPLAGNQEMREILTRRWHECHKCVKVEAHVAAITMMGGLLEALFVARANKMDDKRSLVHATSAPKHRTTGKTLNYQEWMLDSYIKVAYELQWISQSAKDVADVLKEYRNYIHPEKELRHGVVLAFNDSTMFWQITKALTRQLLVSAKNV